MNILLVEDHDGFAQAAAHVLGSRGYETETAGTAEDALKRVQARFFDLVLIDVALPGRNGIWLLKKLAESKPGLPCLMLSGYANEQYVDQSLSAGAHGYVLKEDLPGLLEAIEMVLRGGSYVSRGAQGGDDPAPVSP